MSDETKRRVSRSLSEEFFSRSPSTQAYIKTMVCTIPTSKFTSEYTNIDKYNESSPKTKTNMVIFGLVPPNSLLCRKVAPA